MSTEIPSQMNALIVEGHGKLALKQTETPKPDDHSIIVRVHNVALNPTDWKHLDFIGRVGTTLGSDFVGTVVSKGAQAGTDVQIGDRVAGMVHGGWDVGVGAFADYLKTHPAAVMRVPASVKDEEAAGLGVGANTAYFGLFQPKHLGLPAPEPTLTSLPPVDQTKKLLVWSGATSVGQFVIQFARAAGIHVIATASPKNHAFLKELGAAETYDYSDAATPDKISAAHPDLTHAFDTFSEKGSQESCARALSKTQPSKLVATLPLSKELASVNDKVKGTTVLLYTVGGEEVNMFGLHFSKEYAQEDQRFLSKVMSGGILAGLLSSGLVKPNHTSPQTGGLQAIPAGLDRQRTGKVSGEKLTYAL